jgi:hypothetical protein
LQLTDAAGQVNGHIEVVEADTREVIYRSPEHALVFPHRRHLLQACFRIRNCVFPRPGVYWVEFFCDRQFVTDRTVQLRGPGE